jgi:hypothetical protein
MTRLLTLLLLVLSLCACGGGDSGTSPSTQNQIPDVAGSYSGTLAETLRGIPNCNYATTINVAQAGSNLTITGTMVCGGISQPFLTPFTGTVNSAGRFTLVDPLTINHPQCGATGITISATFSNNSLQWNESDSTALCGLLTYVGTLSR